MRILILGGTADGRKLAESLHQQGFAVIYSVAGLVRAPKVSCQVISGGFTQFGGLENFLHQQTIQLLIDVTHPYAATMSTTAVTVCKKIGIPCWRFHRAEWQAHHTDRWQHLATMQQIINALSGYRSVFLSCGQITQHIAEQLHHNNPSQQQVLRTAAKPTIQLPPSMHWIQAIGPFTFEAELALLQGYHMDIIVSKNSGGDATKAKLIAARQLDIPVLMLQRPTLPAADQLFCSATAIEYALTTRLSSRL